MVVLPGPVVALVQRQLGVVARFQLLRWLTSDQIDSLVQRRTFVRLERGVYRLRGSAVVPGQRAMAAVLRSRPPAALTGPAVLGMYGVDGFSADDAFEVLLPGDRRLHQVRFAWRTDPRPDRDTTRRGAVRLCTPEDAVVHSVRWRAELGDRSLRLAVHWLGWRGLVDREAFLDRLVRRAVFDVDARTMLEVLGGEVLGRCESEGERCLGWIAACFDPGPEPQVWLRASRRTDWFFRDLAFGLEYDGALDHRGRANELEDARRDAELTRAGVQILRVGPEELADPHALTIRIATALVTRAAELGVAAPRFDPARLVRSVGERARTSHARSR